MVLKIRKISQKRWGRLRWEGLVDLLSPSLTYPVGEFCGQQVLYQQPSRDAHQAVGGRAFPVAAAQVWTLKWSTRGRRLIVIIADFPPSTKKSSFQLSYPHLIFWPLDWHRYSGPCSNVRYLGHSKIYVYLLTYLLTLSLQWKRQEVMHSESGDAGGGDDDDDEWCIRWDDSDTSTL